MHWAGPSRTTPEVGQILRMAENLEPTEGSSEQWAADHKVWREGMVKVTDAYRSSQRGKSPPAGFMAKAFPGSQRPAKRGRSRAPFGTLPGGKAGTKDV